MYLSTFYPLPQAMSIFFQQSACSADLEDAIISRKLSDFERIGPTCRWPEIYGQTRRAGIKVECLFWRYSTYAHPHIHTYRHNTGQLCWNVFKRKFCVSTTSLLYMKINKFWFARKQKHIFNGIHIKNVQIVFQCRYLPYKNAKIHNWMLYKP